MFKLKHFLKNYKRQVILGPIFKLVEAIIELIIPLIMARVIDIGIKNRNVNYSLKMGILMITLGAIGLTSAIVCQYYAAQASQGFGSDVRNELFKHINNLSYKELDKVNNASLITRLTNDINQLQLAVSMFIRLVIRSPLLVIGSIVMAMTINIKISIIFIVTAIVIGLLLYVIISRTVPYFRLIQKKIDKISFLTKETLTGIRVIRAFSKQEDEKNKFLFYNNDLTNTAVKVEKVSSLLNPATYIVINLGIASIIWYGSHKAYYGIIAQGEIIALVNYMMQILHSLIITANLVVIFTKATASASRVNEIFEINPSLLYEESSELYNQEPLNSKQKVEIQFKNVSFCYDANCESSINGINFSINKGDTLGIIGGTGAGKTTIANLICRFYDASNGEIYINGIDIKKYSNEDLRKRVSIVSQKAVLFSGTILDNMKWRDENATIDEIKNALDIAHASEFVEKLDDKYNTIVKQGGKNFSGGQRQRLTIARSLVNIPQILILDDSSSALDAATDMILRRNLKQKCKNTTKVIVSQRCSTIRDANKIIVLAYGKQIACGTHDELLQSCDVYKRIWESQKS